MKGSAAAGSAGETDDQVEVLVRLDEEMMAAVHQECELMEDGDIGLTIRRRLTEGLVRRSSWGQGAGLAPNSQGFGDARGSRSGSSSRGARSLRRNVWLRPRRPHRDHIVQLDLQADGGRRA